MMKPILEIKNISKKFRIGHQNQQGYLSLRESLTSIFKATGKRETSEEFWALKDVSFDVFPGQSIGIIGKNGAGKSTFLKILSKITPPTKGKIVSRGRIASLLEVGTGFHPELTGRENIFLNGSILGLRKSEIIKHFDAIVDFSGIEKFLDTPLKHYSSGMQLRLAFSVAAHLEPEILIIDEVLAVGDMEFQKKCMKKMEDVSNSGRTLLIVSHNMSSIQALTNHVVYLKKGQTEGIIPISEGIKKYLYGDELDSAAYFKVPYTGSSKEARILEAKLTDSKGSICERFRIYENIHMEIFWENIEGVKVNPNFQIMNQHGVVAMISLDTTVDFDGSKKRAKGKYLSRAVIPGNILNTGEYFIHLALDNASPRICYDHHMNALHFTIWDPMDEESKVRGLYSDLREDCVTVPALAWSFEKL